MRFIKTTLICSALLVALGPLNIVQCIAWVNMLHSYSQEHGFVEGSRMTLSGDHPCELCCAIAQAKLREHQPTDPDQPSAPAPSPDELSSLKLQIAKSDKFSPALKQPNKNPNYGIGAILGQYRWFDNVPTPPPRHV